MTSPAVDTRLGSGQMFDRIAGRYDLLNRVLSLGVDQSWRRRTVEALELPNGAHALDLATGTGDLALRIARAHPTARVDATDPSEGMLEIGRKKVDAEGLAERVELRVGSAESIPFADASFDGVTIAFGIRNVSDRPAALREMARVTKPGGRIAILELSEPHHGVMAPFARFHIRTVVPRVGAFLSGEREYRYLQESIAKFPPPDEFAKTMEASGIRMLRVEPLTFGVCCLYTGEPA